MICERGLFGKSTKQLSGSVEPVKKNCSDDVFAVLCEGGVSGGSINVRNMACERSENSFS